MSSWASRVTATGSSRTYNFGVDSYEVGTGYGHVAITVDDMDATLTRLAAQGIEPERPKYQVREGGSFIAFVRDPDGYRIELIERKPKCCKPAALPGRLRPVYGQRSCTLDLEMKGRKARSRDRLLELDEVERRLKPFGAGTWASGRSRSTRSSVPTVVRARSPATSASLHAFSRDRLRLLEEAFADGGFPPIVTVKLGEVLRHRRPPPCRPRPRWTRR